MHIRESVEAKPRRYMAVSINQYIKFETSHYVGIWRVASHEVFSWKIK
jgi:hypothetical protein